MASPPHEAVALSLPLMRLQVIAPMLEHDLVNGEEIGLVQLKPRSHRRGPGLHAQEPESCIEGDAWSRRAHDFLRGRDALREEGAALLGSIGESCGRAHGTIY